MAIKHKQDTHICVFTMDELTVLSAAITFLKGQLVTKDNDQNKDIMHYLNILARIEVELKLCKEIASLGGKEPIPPKTQK